MRHENDVIMIIAGLVADSTGRRYGDWRHVATGCNALVILEYLIIYGNYGVHAPHCLSLLVVTATSFKFVDFDPKHSHSKK